VSLLLSPDLARALESRGEAAYPEEGAGLILGHVDGERRQATQLLPLPNRSPEASRQRRYSLDARDLMQAEDEAERLGLEILGVYHSHPDHPARPSETDLELALPWYCYVITSVERGRAGESAAWRLADDHTRFEAYAIDLLTPGG
jgi:proteasome lid subunit RPN8/RPN11